MSVYFPIRNTICKQWANFITCGPSSGGSEGSGVSKDISIITFNNTEQNGYLKILIRQLSGKKGMGQRLVDLQFFGHLKRTLDLDFRLNKPSCKILVLLIWYDHPWKKQEQQINKNPWCFFWQTLWNFIFIDRSLEPLEWDSLIC
jgi:hypothetical protein